MTDEPPYDDDELAQATRLSRALDPRRGTEAGLHGVDDALEAADVVSLLKAPMLNEARESAVLQKVENAIQAARRRTRTKVVLASGFGALAIAASALLVVLGRSAEAPMTAAPSPEPRAEAQSAASAVSPTASALRESQIAWLKAPAADTDAALERALGAYRDEELAALARRYAR
jgi:hypothetical protein